MPGGISPWAMPPRLLRYVARRKGGRGKRTLREPPLGKTLEAPLEKTLEAPLEKTLERERERGKERGKGRGKVTVKGRGKVRGVGSIPARARRG